MYMLVTEWSHEPSKDLNFINILTIVTKWRKIQTSKLYIFKTDRAFSISFFHNTFFFNITKFRNVANAFFLEFSVPFEFHPGSFGWMVRFSEIQQFPVFLELFPGNFRTIAYFADMAAILNSIVLNIYYGMLRGQINMYLSPEHPIIDIWNNKFKNGRRICEMGYGRVN